MIKFSLITLLAFCSLSAFAQDSSLNKAIITRNSQGYKLNGVKVHNIKYLKPYLMQYEQSGLEYKKAHREASFGIACFSIGLVGLATVLIINTDKAAQIVGFDGTLPAFGAMMYFGLRFGSHMKKSIHAYNDSIK